VTVTTRLIHGDCLDVMAGLEDSSIDLIVTDPPYYRVKNLPWDKQWANPAAFLEWLRRVLEQFYRVLKPNGSLYLFASPKMAARVELAVGGWLEVLNNIRWVKEAGWHKKAVKEEARSYFSPWESVIFAEHHGADGYAKGEAGWAHKCDELRGFVFEPLRAYLDGEKERAGMTTRNVAELFQKKTGSRTVTGMAGHWFSQVQWTLPTAENYQWLRDVLAQMNNGGEYLRRDYEDLRRDYEDLRRDYEDLRRPFNVSAEVPYTDVWTYATVQAYKGKHPCEKPLDMLLDIIRASSRSGDVVADFFMGSGNTGIAAQQLGRSFIGCDLSEHWHGVACQRIRAAQNEMVQLALES